MLAKNRRPATPSSSTCVLQCVMLYIFSTRRVAHVRAYMIMRFGFVKNRYDTLGGGGGGVGGGFACTFGIYVYNMYYAYILLYFFSFLYNIYLPLTPTPPNRYSVMYDATNTRAM